MGTRLAPYVAIAAAATCLVFFLATRRTTGPVGEDAPSVDGAASEEPALSAAPGGALTGAARATVAGTGLGAVALRLVRGPDRAPVPGVPVIVEVPVEGGTRSRGIAWTDDRGEARVTEIAPGEGYRVRVQPAASPPVDRNSVSVFADETTDLGTVVLTAIGLIDGLVLDEDREPILGAKVSATLDPDLVHALDADPWPLASTPAFSLRTLETDDRGRFRLDGIPPGLAAVRVTAAGRRGATDRVLVPSQGPNSAWVVFVLGRGAGFFGRVVDDGGSPLAEATVEVGESPPAGFVPKASATTDANGRFGTWGFGAIAVADLRVTAKGGGTAIFSGLAPDVELALVVPRSSRLLVTVLSEETKEPVASAVVSFVITDASRPTRKQRRVEGPETPTPLARAVAATDGRGRATLHVAAGRPVDFEVRHREHRTARISPRATKHASVAGEVERRLDRDEERSLIVSLRRGCPLRVEAYGADGQPLAGARVLLSPGEGKFPETTRTDAAGRASFEHVVPENDPTVGLVDARGRVLVTGRIKVAADGLSAYARLFLTDPAASTATAEATGPPPETRVTGRVVDPAGRPVAGAAVSLDGNAALARTDPEGRFTLVPAAPFRSGGSGWNWVLQARVESLGSGRSAVVTIRDGESTSGVEIALVPYPEIHGVVLDAAGNRVRFPLVELVPAGSKEPVRTVTAEEFGDFRFRVVPPGAWRVRARARGVAGALPDPIHVTEGDPRPVPFAQVRVVPFHLLAVSVVDLDGRPVDNALVQVQASSLPAKADPTLEVVEAYTGLDGTCRLATACKVYDVRARHDDAGSGHTEVPQDADRVEVRLSRRVRPAK